jgi:hypothetical protein
MALALALSFTVTSLSASLLRLLTAEKKPAIWIRFMQMEKEGCY